MTNDLTMRPAYLGGSFAPEGAFADTLGFAQPPRISMRDDRFNVLNENKAAVMPPSLDLNVIVLWENDTRIYFPRGEYDADSGTPPSCYSDNRVTPSVGAMQPQSDLCATCPHSVWDQPTPKGNMVPACDSRYKVACLVAGAGGVVFLLSVAPGSRKAYENYRRHLKANHALPSEVITKLGYKDKALTFEFLGWVNEKTADFVRKLFSTDEAAMVVGAFDKPRTGALPAPNKPVKMKLVSSHVEGTAEFLDAAGIKEPVNNPADSFASPAPQEAPKRGRGRPPKEPPSTIGAAHPAPQPSIAAPKGEGFTDYSKGVPQPPAYPAKGNGGGFGMEAAQAPPANIQEALDRAFGPR